MFRNTFAIGGTLLVAAALVLLTPGDSLAHRGGASVGGYRGGVYGGARVGGYRGGFYGIARVGGYRSGVVAGYHHPSYQGGYHGYQHHYPYHAWGAYYPYSYGGYASSVPSYGDYAGPAYSYDPYASYYTNYPSYATSGSPTDPYGAATPLAPPENQAYVTVTVPAGATVWFDGAATTSAGPVRQYVTPPLAPGERSTYWVRARWSENGREVNQLQPVEVTAGGSFQVSFPAAPRTGW
jgi:uncharacterized protein (TIGR03000 family)